MYYVEDYWTNEIIDTSTDLDNALAICKATEGSIVTDDDDNVFLDNSLQEVM